MTVNHLATTYESLLTSWLVSRVGGIVLGHIHRTYCIKVLAKFILTIHCLYLLLNMEFVAGK